MPTREWPRRGTHWDVFNADGELEIERMDEPPDTATEEEQSAWDDRPLWPEGTRFLFDDDAAGFVLATASRVDALDTPDEVIRECRQAVREIVKSWGRS